MLHSDNLCQNLLHHHAARLIKDMLVSERRNKVHIPINTITWSHWR